MNLDYRACSLYATRVFIKDIFMSEKIIQIGSAITKYVLTSFDAEYLHSVFGGVIDIDDLVDQVILECIKKAFDFTEDICIHLHNAY